MRTRYETISLAITVAFAASFSASCATSSHDLATSSLEEEQYEAAVPHLEKCSAEGDERCDYLMAKLMFSGDLGDPDPEAGAKWLTTAALAGLPGAQSDLGKLYQSGIGVEQDIAKAVEWYRSAADAGQPEAQANLGFLHDSGRGVEKDAAQAVELFREAAEQGHGMAQGALGLALFQGVGVSKNIVEGYKWTILAAEKQDWTAMENMHEMADQMTAAQRSIARRRATEFQTEGDRPPRRSRLREMKKQQQNKERGARRRSVHQQ